MTQQLDPRCILWTDAEPARLAQDQREIPKFAPGVNYHPPGELGFPHGGWCGRLPLWPFVRPEPRGLHSLLGEDGLEIALIYPAAYPLISPRIVPNDPRPTIDQCTQSAWHVAPDGSLCLLQTQGAWHPEASVVELLVKAAGWNVEYALMQAGVVDRMSIQGIVSDDSRDHLVAEAADTRTRERDETRG